MDKNTTTKEKMNYPYFDMPFEGREIRPYIWIFLNRPTFYLNSTEFWQVPEHYVTDGYSIPYPFRWIVQKGKANNLAPGFHDYLCEYAKSGRLQISYKKVHYLFAEMMKASVWLEEEQKLVKIEPEFEKTMAFAVKHFGPRW